MDWIQKYNNNGRLCIGVFSLGILLGGCGQQNEKHSAVTSIVSALKMPLLTPAYTLQSSKDCTVERDKPCRRISIIVPKGQSRAQLDFDMTNAIQKAVLAYGSARGVVFARAAGTNLHGPYSAARAIWGFDDDTDQSYTADAPRIDYIDSYFKPTNSTATPDDAGPVSTARIPLSKRQEIFIAIGQCEDRASEEAETTYPTTISTDMNDKQEDQIQRNVPLNEKMYDQLVEKYHQNVQKRYQLTDEQFTDISTEGADKQWPRSDDNSN